MPKTAYELEVERRNTGNVVNCMSFTENYKENAEHSENFTHWIPVAMKWSAHAQRHNHRYAPFWVDFSIEIMNEKFISSNFEYRLKVGDAEERVGPLATVNTKGVNCRFEIFDVDNSATRYSEEIKVTIALRIVYVGHPRMKNKEYTPIKISSDSFFSDMLKNSVMSDFKFIIQGKEFKVHKNVMATASPMLLKMFTTDMAENKEGESKIDHIKPGAFDAMLKFIYRVEAPWNVDYRDLYAAAHYFQIEALKAVCEQQVHTSLDVGNAIEIFLWAYPYEELEGLKYDAWDVIKVKALANLRKEPFEIVDFKVIKAILEKVQDFNDVIDELL